MSGLIPSKCGHVIVTNAGSVLGYMPSIKVLEPPRLASLNL